MIPHLSVNINKIATLRNARGKNNPDVLAVAKDCEAFGAQGITVHPRPDERHIRKSDVFALKDIVKTEFNIEGYPSDNFIEMVLRIIPDQVTLVPDAPGALTSNAGWDCVKHETFLTEVIAVFKKAGIRTSIFLNPDETQVEYAAKTGTDRIELYTESYAEGFEKDKEVAINPFENVAKSAIHNNLGVNAGHDLSLKNLAFFIEKVPGIQEVSIGHALICNALYFGLDNTIKMFLHQIKLGHQRSLS
jgi:pyridoxine 5-phosphate synthase